MAMSVPDRIKRAHIAIMQHKVFAGYSGVLSCGKVKFDDNIMSAQTNGWDVTYNPKFVEQFMPTDPELRFLVLHEATHKAFRHLHVWREIHEEDHQLANIAADLFVNLALVDADKGEGFIKMPAIGIQPDPQYRGMSVGQIYQKLKEDPPPEGGGEGMDEHDWQDAQDGSTAEEVQKRADEIQRALRQGEMLRKKLAGKGEIGRAHV